jgi:ABC-2 type transport system ATP-binding protein
MPILDVQHLVHRYGQHRAVDDISFTVEEGACFGLLGPNGAGKSTLISILSCYREATSGLALLLGQKLSPANLAIRSSIGLAPQEIAVYGPLTARENLAFFGKLYGMTGKLLSDRVDSLLEAVGLTNKADARVETFSGGMQRRMNLAAALVHQPKLLLLDEPTAGVDPQSRNHLFEEIRRCNQQGTTIIYTTHYMEEVEALCKTVAIMDHGKIVANDTLDRLLNHIPSRVTVTLAAASPTLEAEISTLGDVKVDNQLDGLQLELESPAAESLLTRTIRAMQRAKVEPVKVEASTPSLERVFLQLTGRALRD